ncbi:MAG: sigma-70 family RNA polymerase sigma factor [Cyclobacteriaceae bacterium]|nr:sigma-70 family RNA polymerase sigma factor [Cyclobacteriaceae bacterium HetDA_MAG_MS6]
MKDSEILERIGRGDERVLDYLYKKYYRMMNKIVLSNNGTEEEAQDVYQEALIAFWQKAASGKLVLTSKISTYLYSICQNQWRKELDRKSRLSREEKDGNEYQSYEEDETFRIVMQCIGELGDPCKSLLTYYYFDGMSMTDIAKKLNFANQDTAKTKKYKCKKRLDSLIKQRYTEKDFFN